MDLKHLEQGLTHNGLSINTLSASSLVILGWEAPQNDNFRILPGGWLWWRDHAKSSGSVAGEPCSQAVLSVQRCTFYFRWPDFRRPCEDGRWGQTRGWQSCPRHGLHVSFCPWPPSAGGSMLISAVCCFFLFFGNSESAMIGWQCLFCGTSIAAWNALDVITVELYPTNQRSVLPWASLWDSFGLLWPEVYLLHGPLPWSSWSSWCSIDQISLRLLSFSCMGAGIGLAVAG